MIKAELRKINLARQKSLSAAEKKQKSRQITDSFFRTFALIEVQYLHCFTAIEKHNEIDTSLIFERVRREFPRLQMLVPRVNFGGGKIESVKITRETKLEKNIWQIDEPIAGEIIEARKIDAVLVPLLGFDEKGFRAGYGKGFYDKFLKICRADCLKIGLSYFAPIEKISDVENFDVKLDFCLTPEKVWQF